MLVVGLDHSLTGFGLAAVHPSWGLDFRQVRRYTLATDTSDGPRVARRAALARDVVAWIEWQAGRLEVPLSDVRVFIEGGVFHARKADTVRSQERLAAVVEDRLWSRLSLKLVVAEQQSVRTTFMGRSARGRGIGDAMQELLKAAAPETEQWDEAELDAFLVANHGLSVHGEAFISCAPPTVAAPRRRHGRAA